MGNRITAVPTGVTDDDRPAVPLFLMSQRHKESPIRPSTSTCQSDLVLATTAAPSPPPFGVSVSGATVVLGHPPLDTDISSIRNMSDERLVDMSQALFDDPDLVVVGMEHFSDGMDDLAASPQRAAAIDGDQQVAPLYSDISARRLRFHHRLRPLCRRLTLPVQTAVRLRQPSNYYQ